MKPQIRNLTSHFLICFTVVFLAACSGPNKEIATIEPPPETEKVEIEVSPSDPAPEPVVAPVSEIAPQETVIDRPKKIIIYPSARSSTEVIGEVEPVYVVRAGMLKQARIDTGATTSSIDIDDYTEFERDGKKWIRYRISDRTTGETVELENRVIKYVRIKRIDAESHRRPVIRLDIRLGNKTLTEEFTLADRAELDYPVLIGRNILEGNFVVDVSRKNTTSRMAEE